MFSLKIETIGSEALPDLFQGLQWPVKWSQLCIYTMQWLETQQHLLKSKFKKICCTKIWNSTATSPPKKWKCEILPVLPSFLVGISHDILKLTREGSPEALLMCHSHNWWFSKKLNYNVKEIRQNRENICGDRIHQKPRGYILTQKKWISNSHATERSQLWSKFVTKVVTAP